MTCAIPYLSWITHLPYNHVNLSATTCVPPSVSKSSWQLDQTGSQSGCPWIQNIISPVFLNERKLKDHQRLVATGLDHNRMLQKLCPLIGTTFPHFPQFFHNLWNLFWLITSKSFANHVKMTCDPEMVIS